MVTSTVMLLVGYLLAFAGGFMGTGIMSGPVMLQPMKPGMLLVASTASGLLSLAGAIGGFWLFGWVWLPMFFALAGVGGWIGNRAQAAGAAPGVSTILSIVGVGLAVAGLWTRP